MPNRDEHFKLGVMAGPSYSLISASVTGKQPSPGELLGASISSAFSSHLPDLLEPATHPNHRSTFHSKLFLGVIALFAWPKIEAARWEQLRIAEDCRQNAASSTLLYVQMYWQQEAQRHEIYAGLLGGLIPGYASHLLADAQTPKGLPLI